MQVYIGITFRQKPRSADLETSLRAGRPGGATFEVSNCSVVDLWLFLLGVGEEGASQGCIVLIDMTTFKEYRNKENGLETKCKLSASPSLYIFCVYNSHVLLPMMYLRGAGYKSYCT